MIGQCEIIRTSSVLNSPEVKHFSDLSELSDIGEKCKTLSDRAMKSSIHCATSIAEMKTLLKSDFVNILSILESLNTEFALMSQDITLMGDHITKLSAILYEVQDMIKDKMKSFDEKFQNFDRVLLDFGDIIKETNRRVVSTSNIPQPRHIVKPSISKTSNIKPTPKK